MQTLTTSIQINAPRQRVWDVMLADETYRQWTAPFNAGGSYFQGDWSQGSVMKFIGPDPETGEEGGMLSKVAENRQPEFLSLQHYGMLVNGQEDTTSDAVKEWAPAFENYTFTEKDGGTELTVEMQIDEKYKAEFEKMWPEALQLLKELAEQAVT